MRIVIETIPHSQQRYDTQGDWLFFGDDLIIKVSEQTKLEYVICIGIHELVEAILCRKAGISSDVVDRWDMANLNDPDPGSIVGSPYANQHISAMDVEMSVANAVGISWEEYGRDVET